MNSKDVIIALDFDDKEKVYNFLKPFEEDNVKPFVKIGMELYYKEGNEIVKQLKQKGYKVFLDLKLHDIPNTVTNALKVLKDLNVDIINVHAFGSKDMLKKASEVFKNSNTMLIGVSVLTSLDEEQLKFLTIEKPVNEVVLTLATLCKDCGLDGLVCSPLEVKELKHKLGDEFKLITPGIRISGEVQDQKRVLTPKEAGKKGSDYIVVGRDITLAQDPLKVYKKIKKDFLGE